MDDFECGGYVFNSKFDSGNLARVEFVPRIEGTFTEKSDYEIDAEFNLWTRPDCAGTKYENLNRTWFFFSIKGGEPFRLVKFNIMNLNKQGKLFTQGMQPVMRFGDSKTSKWERIKDKPTYHVTTETFVVSFFHKNLSAVTTIVPTYYAFTFPFTYTQLLTQLSRFDHIYGKNQTEIEQIIQCILSKRKGNKTAGAIKEDQTVSVKSSRSGMSCLDKSTETTDLDSIICDNTNNNSLISSNPSTTESVQYLTNLVNNVKIELNDSNSNREIEIAKKFDQDQQLQPSQSQSQQQISNLDDIYYHRDLIIHSYEKRRIDLLTITSYHGILNKREESLKNLYPDIKSQRCHLFKDKKIIFISSRVHPGETPASFVLNGFLNLLFDRENVIAMTLRRLYVFKIVPFLNPDGVYNGNYRTDMFGVNLNRVYINPSLTTQPSIYAVRKLIRYYHFGFDKPEHMEANQIYNADIDDSNCSSSNIQELFLKLTNENCDKKDSSPTDSESPSLGESPQSSSEKDTSPPNTDTSYKKKDNTESTSSSSVSNENNKSFPLRSAHSKNKRSGSLIIPKSKEVNSSNVYMKKVVTNKNDIKFRNTPSHVLKNIRVQQKTGPQRPVGQKNINISMDFIMDEKGEKHSFEEKSNMFLYMDLHGHASKKGVFMYGNHLPSTMEAVECMLLPRLMSMNCHHFHFDACNFSERNMYYKGKRDGLSKEGSGRVAVYKSTGLIKSYTLESNYNTGKCVNILPPKAKETTQPAQKISNAVPPKYTPEVFEEVGRALGASILDLTNSNPMTRLYNSEFHSLQGLRNLLKKEVDRSTTKVRANKVTNVKSVKTKRLLNASTVSSIDMSKENKGFSHINNSNNNSNSVHWDNVIESVSSNLSIPCCSAPRQIISKTGIKKLGRKIQNKTNFVNSNLSKKTKILCDATTSTTGQVPRKKIKVTSQHIGAINKGDNTAATPKDTITLTCYAENSANKKYTVDGTCDMYFPTTATSLPNFITTHQTITDPIITATTTSGTITYPVTKKIKSENKLTTQKNIDIIDDSSADTPCCSTSLSPSVTESMSVLNFHNKNLGRTNNNNSGSNNINSNNNNITINNDTNVSDNSSSSNNKIKSKYSKTTSTSSPIKQLSKLNKTNEVSNLKKKRTLKTDTKLKRKKNRKISLHN